MLRLSKRVSGCLAILALLYPCAHAGSKEDAARELLAKSFQQANIWTQGPVQLTAKVRMPRPKKPDVNLTYEVSWAGPDQWRAEWSGGGYSRVIVVSNGKLYRFSSTPTPPLPLLQYETAIGALSGHGLGGPAMVPPDLTSTKIRANTPLIGKSKTECLILPGHFPGDFCVDTVSARAVSLASGADVFQYSDYEAVGNVQFPRSIRLMFGNDLQEDSTITVDQGMHFPDAPFAAPANSTVSDFPSCNDANKISVGSRLDKKVQPEYPENARMARHQGTVWLYAIIAKDGSVQSAKSMHDIWPELEHSAIEAVKSWRFTPYLRCGQPLEYETIISVNYSLSSF